MTEVSAARMSTFLAVARHGSIRAAAEHLHVTEAAVSTAVSQTEKGLGAKLLARSGRGVELTHAGTVYADYCRTILGLMKEARAAVRNAEEGRLRIGVVATVGEYVLLPLLAAFRDRYPNIELNLSIRSRDDLFADLAHHESDVVIAGRPPHGMGFVTRARRPATLVVVGDPAHRFDPDTATWLLRSERSGTRASTLRLLEELSITPPTMTLGTHGAVVAGARAGLGVALVHSDAVQSDIDAGRLEILPVDGTPLDRPWHVITTDTFMPSAQLFLEHITDAEQFGAEAFA
ncbi:MAG: LysR family transcriptional regulator [Nocardiaceae bacterium]|nr:LysR family transcriptional regulator [Nocardiaceae bacterium]